MSEKKGFFEAKLYKKRSATGFSSYVDCPFDAAEFFGKTGNIPVNAIIDGHEYPTCSLVWANQVHILLCPLKILQKIGKTEGQTVSVAVEFDPEPRLFEMPIDLEDALENDPKAKRIFDLFATSWKRGIVKYFDTSKTAETRMRRIEKALTRWKTEYKDPLENNGKIK